MWATQAARNLFLRHADGLAGTRGLVRGRGNQFIDAFDEIFRTERMKVLKIWRPWRASATLPQTPTPLPMTCSGQSSVVPTRAI